MPTYSCTLASSLYEYTHALLLADYVSHRLKYQHKLAYNGLLIDVADFRDLGHHLMHFAKRLIDYGFHLPALLNEHHLSSQQDSNAPPGEMNLGKGFEYKDFDKRLVDRPVQDFKRKDEVNLTATARALRRLQTACERAIQTLSSAAQTTIAIDSLFKCIGFSTSITRTCLGKLCGTLSLRTIGPAEEVLYDSVHEIAWVGDTAQIPPGQLVRNSFRGGRAPYAGLRDRVLFQFLVPAIALLPLRTLKLVFEGGSFG